MKFYVTKNAAYSLEDIHKVEKDESWFTGCLNDRAYLLKLVYKSYPKVTIIYFTKEDRDKAFDEILNILKGE